MITLASRKLHFDLSMTFSKTLHLDCVILQHVGKLTPLFFSMAGKYAEKLHEVKPIFSQFDSVVSRHGSLLEEDLIKHSVIKSTEKRSEDVRVNIVPKLQDGTTATFSQLSLNFKITSQLSFIPMLPDAVPATKTARKASLNAAPATKNKSRVTNLHETASADFASLVCQTHFCFALQPIYFVAFPVRSFLTY